MPASPKAARAGAPPPCLPFCAQSAPARALCGMKIMPSPLARAAAPLLEAQPCSTRLHHRSPQRCTLAASRA
eukprot:165535-Pleurochrysis_carterae.AAC.1